MNIKLDYPDCSVSDSFLVGEKYKSKEDVEGNCYDWYYISNHNRIIDKTPSIVEKIEAITPYVETKTAYIGDTEICFHDIPEGNLSVFFPYPHTVDRLADRIIISFDPLEEITKISISIYKEV